MSKYLKENDNTDLSKIIFSIGSGALDIKKCKKWKKTCVLCVTKETKKFNILWSAHNMATMRNQYILMMYTNRTHKKKQFKIAENFLYKHYKKK